VNVWTQTQGVLDETKRFEIASQPVYPARVGVESLLPEKRANIRDYFGEHILIITGLHYTMGSRVRRRFHCNMHCRSGSAIRRL